MGASNSEIVWERTSTGAIRLRQIATRFVGPITGVAGTGLNDAENEIPAGAVNGVNATFTLANTPVLDSAGTTSLKVYSDGIRLNTADFTIAGAALTITVAPNIPTDSLLVDYRW